MNTSTLHIRIEPGLLADLKEAAKKEKRMVSEVVRGLIVKYIRNITIDQSVKRMSNSE